MRERTRFSRQLFVQRRAVIPEVFVDVGLYDLLAGQLPQEWPLPHLGDVIGGLPFGAVLIVGLLLLLAVSVEGGYREKQDETRKRETAERERDEYKAQTALKARRIDVASLSGALTDSILGYHETYQVYAPYGDDEAYVFAEDISRALRINGWQGQDKVERQLYEDGPRVGVGIWRADEDDHQNHYATRLKDFLAAQHFKVEFLDDEDRASLGLSRVIEVHVRAQER